MSLLGLKKNQKIVHKHTIKKSLKQLDIVYIHIASHLTLNMPIHSTYFSTCSVGSFPQLKRRLHYIKTKKKNNKQSHWNVTCSGIFGTTMTSAFLFNLSAPWKPELHSTTLMQGAWGGLGYHFITASQLTWR